MKSLILICALLSFSPVSLIAQKQICVDFYKKTQPDVNEVRKIKEGEYYQIVINDINLSLYKVSLIAKDTILFPAQHTPTFADLSTSSISGLLSGVTSLAALPELPIPIVHENTRVHGASAFKNKETKAADEVNTNNDIRQRMDEENKRIVHYKEDLLTIKGEIDELIYKITYFQLKGKLEFKSSEDYKSLDNLAPNFDIAKEVTSVITIRDAIETTRTKLLDDYSAYTVYASTEENRKLISTDTDLKKGDAVINNYYAKLTVTIDATDSIITPAKVNDLFSAIIAQKNAGYTFTSLPILFRNDQAQVSLSITPIASGSTLQSYNLPFVFPVRINKYVGVAVSFYGSSLHNDAYSTISFKRDTAKSAPTLDSIVKEQPGQGEFGMTAMMQYGTKIYKDFVGLHVSFGPGISISNTVRARVLFGGGITFGHKNMISFNFGGIAGYVDRLSEALDTKTAYSSLPTTTTVSSLNVGVFGSVGYVYKF